MSQWFFSNIWITYSGLAKLLHCEPDPKSIVRAIKEGDYAKYVSPHFGGVKVYDNPLYEFIVLPPMAPEDLLEIHRAAREIGFNKTITIADSMNPVACVVGLAFYKIRRLEEVLTPMYGQYKNKVS